MILCKWCSDFMVDARVEGASIKFCVNLGKSDMETLKMIKQEFGEQSISGTHVFEWYVQFRSGH